MKVSTVLRKSRTLLVEQGWTKGELARNKYRHKVDPTSPSAVKFCAQGAIHNVLGVSDDWRPSEGSKQVSAAMDCLMLAAPAGFGWPYTVDDYNDADETTLEDIKDWFVRAIVLAKQDSK